MFSIPVVQFMLSDVQLIMYQPTVQQSACKKREKQKKTSKRHFDEQGPVQNK